VDLLVGEPWSQATIEANAAGFASPPREALDSAAITFFEGVFATKVLEFVHDIQRTISSSSAREALLVREGSASQAEVDRCFPALPGSHLQMSSPALEFSKMLCHLIGLDPQLAPQLGRLRRNLLKLLGVREFALEAQFVNPCNSFVLPDVVCEFCGHCRDVDTCRDADWSCECCETPYDKEALEYLLVSTLLRRGRRFHAQDLQCTTCKSVQSSPFAAECERCSAPFELRLPQHDLGSWLGTFGSLAAHHGMAWLQEALDWLSP